MRIEAHRFDLRLAIRARVQARDVHGVRSVVLFEHTISPGLLRNGYSMRHPRSWQSRRAARTSTRDADGTGRDASGDMGALARTRRAPRAHGLVTLSRQECVRPTTRPRTLLRC